METRNYEVTEEMEQLAEAITKAHDAAFPRVHVKTGRRSKAPRCIASRRPKRG